VRHTPIPDNFTQAVGWFQIFLGVATVLLAFYVGRRLFGVTAGLLAAAWLALFPNLIFHTGTYLSETQFNFLIMAAMAVLVGSTWPKGELTTGRLLAAGAILGAAALVRPIALLLLPLLIAGWLLAGARWKRAGVQIAILGLATVAVIMPWAIRNFVVMDAPIVISANLGDDLCIGHHPGATGHFELPPECFEGYDEYVRPEFEVRRNNDGIRSSIDFALDHPWYELKLLALKARWTYDHDHDGLWAVESYGDDPFINEDLRQFLSKVADIYFFTTISIGGLGLIGILLTRTDARRVFLALATIAFGAIPLMFFGDARFHVPAMPLLVLAAAWAVVTAVEAAPRLLGGASGASGSPSVVEVSERERAVAEQDAL
jgi:4-amino-4-deoxy-L-arabinose transferase-like glycosyltransferase